MMQKNWHIPPSMLKHLAHIPQDRPVAILLRHSVRGHLPPGEAGNAVPITGEGRKLALDFGKMFGQRLRHLHTSPVLRCVQTAECLNAGAETNHDLVHSRLLGDPGVYVVDGTLAWSNWERLGHEGVVRHLMTSSEPLPGMARPDEAARHLARYMLDVVGHDAGLHAFVTHDVLVAVTVTRLLGKMLDEDEWPWFLEGAFFWRTVEGIRVVYRDWGGVCHSG